MGVVAPKNTPAPIIDTLNKAINAGLADPKIKQTITDWGENVFATSPAEFGKFLAAENEKWGKVIRRRISNFSASKLQLDVRFDPSMTVRVVRDRSRSLWAVLNLRSTSVSGPTVPQSAGFFRAMATKSLRDPERYH